MNRKDVGIPVPLEFVCPITLEPMTHPLFNRAGRSFERRAILEWMSKHGTCPLTRQPMVPSSLAPNRALEARIRFWRENNDIDTPVDQEEVSNTHLIDIFYHDQDVMTLNSAVQARMTQNQPSSYRRAHPKRRRNVLRNMLSPAVDLVHEDL